jgi:hypothetical protein
MAQLAKPSQGENAEEQGFAVWLIESERREVIGPHGQETIHIQPPPAPDNQAKSEIQAFAKQHGVIVTQDAVSKALPINRSKLNFGGPSVSYSEIITVLTYATTTLTALASFVRAVAGLLKQWKKLRAGRSVVIMCGDKKIVVQDGDSPEDIMRRLKAVSPKK